MASVVPVKLPSPVSRAVAFAAQDTFLLCGGLMSSGATTATIIQVDPGRRHVAAIGQLASPVHDAGIAPIAGSAMVVGGGQLRPQTVVQRVASSGASAVIGQLPAPRADLVAVSVGGRVLVVGGGTTAGSDRRVLATADGIRFRTIARLRLGVRYPAVAVIGGIVYVVGGTGGRGDVRDIQTIDPASGTVGLAGRLPVSLSHAAALVVGGRFLIAGGRHAGRAVDAIWQFDPATGIARRIGRLPYPVSDAASVVVAGVGYLVGGEADRLLSTLIALTVP